jgi:chromosome partitioning protein
MRTIAVLNQKGGSGKTTTAVNLAGCLAELGKRVLLIDVDSQANSTSHYGVKPTGKGVFDVFVENGNLLDLIVLDVSPNVDIAPGTPWLAQLPTVLAGEVGAEFVLKKALDTLPADRWDFVIIDCPPALGIVTVAALTAVREIVVPVETQVMALSGLAALVQTVEKVRSRLNPDIAIAAILPVRAKASTSLTREVIDRLREHFGALVLNTSIRENTRIAEAYGYAKPVNLYDTRSTGAEDYRAATREMLDRAPERN